MCVGRSQSLKLKAGILLYLSGCIEVYQHFLTSGVTTLEQNNTEIEELGNNLISVTGTNAQLQTIVIRISPLSLNPQRKPRKSSRKTEFELTDKFSFVFNSQ